MKFPEYTQPALLAAAGGAVAMAVVGFSWLGWVTGGTAEKNATTRADTAVVAAMAPVCVDRFDRAPGASRTALKAIDSWSQGDFIEKGGWAATNPAERVTMVAKACAELLAAAPESVGLKP